MTLTELKYITALARTQHFGQAAELCHISQPTLSVAVKKLEEELGVALFERNKQDVRLTALGSIVIVQAQKVLDEADRITVLASSGRDELKGLLRIGAIFTVGPYILPHLLPKLHQAAPQMPLYIVEDYTDNLRKKLLSGDLDIIYVSAPFREPGVVSVPLFVERFNVLLPKDHPLAKLEVITPDDLKDQNVLLLGEGHCFRDEVLEACPGCGVSRKGFNSRLLEGSSIETLRYMVAGGLGVTVLPALASTISSAFDHTLVIRPFENPAPHREVALAYREGFPRQKAVELMCKIMLEMKHLDVAWVTPSAR
jgi:LysR family hydrogen peroxide-inducible transcriptional activator